MDSRWWPLPEGRLWSLLLLALALAACRVPLTFGRSVSSGPNVLFILTDDMRSDSLWSMPRMSELARHGITFRRFFVTTPLCCPSRATYLTGLYAHNHGVLANSPPQGGVESFHDQSTLATWLQKTGVRTGLSGRYLNGYASASVPPGWDFWFALWQASEDYSNYFDYRVTDQTVSRYYGSRADQYSTRVLTDQALKFIGQDASKPFFLHLSPRSPHGPATPDRDDSGMYKTQDWPVPPNFNEEDVDDKWSGIRRLKIIKEKSVEDIEVFRRRQWETLYSLDRGIGQLVDALKADGRLDRTWIVFASDNGIALGEHRIDVQKSCPYEECVRVPLIIVPPGGLSEGRVDDHLVANIDIAPTIAEIMSAQPEFPTDGRSLLPLIRDEQPEWRDALLLEVPKEESGDQFVAIRTSNRKLIRYPTNEVELFDEDADPYELASLSSEAAWAAELARLQHALDDLRRATGRITDG